MAQFSLFFTMDNAAFDDFPEQEVARILRTVADEVEESFPDAGTVRDLNGNGIGRWQRDRT